MKAKGWFLILFLAIIFFNIFVRTINVDLQFENPKRFPTLVKGNHLHINVIDSRKTKTHIGLYESFWSTTKKIETEKDISSVIKEAMEFELSQIGFKTHDSNDERKLKNTSNTLKIEGKVKKIFIKGKQGFWNSSPTSIFLTFEATVHYKGRQYTENYPINHIGDKINSWVFASNPIKSTFKSAIKKLVAKIINDVFKIEQKKIKIIPVRDSNWVRNAFFVDSRQNVHIVLIEDFALKYITNYGGEWSSRILLKNDKGIYQTQNMFPSSDLSLFVESSGYVHIVFAAKNDLRYLSNRTGKWISEIIAKKEFNDTISISAFIDCNGHIHLAYEHERALKYATNKSGKWLNTVVKPSTSFPSKFMFKGISLWVTPNLQPHISCAYIPQDLISMLSTSCELVYFTNNKTWVTDKIKNLKLDRGFVSYILVDSQGIAHIIHTSNQGAKYANNKSGVMTYTKIPSTPSIQDPDYLITLKWMDKIFKPSFDASGNISIPYISSMKPCRLILDHHSKTVDIREDTSIDLNGLNSYSHSLKENIFDKQGKTHIFYGCKDEIIYVNY